MIHNTLSKVFLVVALCIIATGCVDHSYDLEQIDRNVTVARDGIDIPIGSIAPTTVGDLVGDDFDDLVTVNDDGSYSLSYSSDEPFDVRFSIPSSVDRTLGLKRYKGKYIDVDFPFIGRPSGLIYDANGEADLSKKLPASRKIMTRQFRLPFTITKMPELLTGLSGLTLTSDSEVSLTFSIPDCFLTGGTVTPDITFDVHELFEVEGYPDGMVTFNDLKLTKENGFKATKTLKLKKVVADPSRFNLKKRELDINAHLVFNGNILLSNPKTTKERMQKAPASNNLIIRVKLVNVRCKGVEGMFDYAYKGVKTRLKLGNIAEQFEGDKAPVILTSPSLLLKVASNFGIPARATVKFTAQRKGVTTKEIKNVKFDVPVPTSSATATKTFRFSASGSGGGGTTGVKADIASLFDPVPDVIYIDMDIATITTKTGVLDLDTKYQIDLTPQVSSPLAYGPGLNISYGDTLSMPTGFGKLLKDNSLKLIGDVTNTSLLQLGLDVVLTDDAFNPVIPAISKTIAAQGESTVELLFSGENGNNTEKITKAIIRLDGKPSATGKPIKSTEYFKADFRAEIPDGYHFSF